MNDTDTIPTDDWAEGDDAYPYRHAPDRADAADVIDTRILVGRLTQSPPSR